MLFQKSKIRRDVQNMMPKIIVPDPKKKFVEIICNEIFDGKINLKSKNFDDVTN